MNNELHQEFLKVIDLLINKKLKENPKIELIIYGGSVARGDETEHSDIDIGFYCKKKYLPKFTRGFYKFKGKFIEEIFHPIEEFSKDEILDENVVAYDKYGLLKNRKFKSEKEKINNFNKELKKAKKFQKIAIDYFNKKDYEKSVYHILGCEAFSYLMAMALPARLGLPYPSFRLFESIKKIDKELYNIWIKLFNIENFDQKNILKDYEKAYMIMNKCYKNKNPKEKNLGFYDIIKIKYNIECLNFTFNNYPKEYSLKFIIECLIDWSFGEKDLWTLKTNQKYNIEIIKIAKSILGIKEFDEKFAKEKLNILIKIEKRIDELKKY
ncbi:MAG: nucleotidyltransferase domain-containing protein [Candidatus Nanoarchaeia archaeon]|nr:nucleotidyltransferase domain-containing protein [Candidatus Nanoarchaeia archaeon]